MKSLKSFLQRLRTKLNRIRQQLRLWLEKAKLKPSKTLKAKKIKLTKEKKTTPAAVHMENTTGKNYFLEARDWADDMYTAAIISRNRYKVAFLTAMGLAVLLTFTVISVIPLQRMVPLLINHYPDGHVSVQPMNEVNRPKNQALVESEIVRYVINRESYDPSSYPTQYSLISLLSDPDVTNQYIQTQSIQKKTAPINVLGNHGTRSVYIESVVFLDSELKNQGQPKAVQTHHNLAQVNFTMTDHIKNSSITKTQALTALISWRYHGAFLSPENRWRDWDGFTVTRYTVEQRNVSQSLGD